MALIDSVSYWKNGLMEMVVVGSTHTARVVSRPSDGKSWVKISHKVHGEWARWSVHKTPLLALKRAAKEINETIDNSNEKLTEAIKLLLPDFAAKGHKLMYLSSGGILPRGRSKYEVL